ncbi:hypothetical protein TVAG_016400 [Trichomonas vaginalis G3]|uniref:receptor protein-tyrosine kinase n=1 Tax=Trichomonas vaginalis (strain ATCC PRA-98 / G3) TaxID=412133 RepID=A2DPB0_TRIV3|nr:glycine-rich protein family [Trichomonas vaginalis G3]EAY17810.1 hypothetical protein TVAG_016400 [Trichomonas vaginalis G3]KAI5484365.1 glycine-rich protein family [Trichomonas vaginalis G3]|eukprot:XP_001329945.1 hypothetical protein [Trichomonas vaginalis G3]
MSESVPYEEFYFQFGKYGLFRGAQRPGYQPICSGSTCRFLYPCQSSVYCTPVELHLKLGKYFLEVYGASGSDYDSGSFGGYASMIINLLEENPLFLYIGGKGEIRPETPYETFNGGGWGGSVYSGGGATDFRSEDNLESRFLIAGGGGGSANVHDIGTSGGGLKSLDFCGLPGANQTNPGFDGSFGSGYGNRYSAPGNSPGGGGGLFGGGPGSGGSGFVYSENRETDKIHQLPSWIKIEDSQFSYSTNRGPGYAIISSLSHNDCKCSYDYIIPRDIHAAPFLYSYMIMPK